MTSHFDGSAFLPDGRRLSGTLTVSDIAVTLDSPDGSVSVPIEGVSIREGGAADRLIFFEHPSVPDTSIYTSDRKVLDAPALAGHAPQTRRIRSASRRRSMILLTMLLVMIGAIAGLFPLRKPLVAAAANRVPPKLERTLGDAAMRQILLTSKVETNPAVTEPMQKILDEVKRGVGPTSYEFRLVIIRDETVNAFALPGGQLALHTGLIEKARSADEIAGVLAHEVAHVTERHSLRQLISTIGLFTIVQFVLGDVSSILVAAAEGGADLLVLRFSREAEEEADERGVSYLMKAGIDPRGMATFFDTLKEEEGAAGAIPAFLSTHPATEERAARLRGLIGGSAPNRGRPLAVDIGGAKKALEAE
jgi:predicted Zn-dependent protease